jgi:hypothetical protein
MMLEFNLCCYKLPVYFNLICNRGMVGFRFRWLPFFAREVGNRHYDWKSSDLSDKRTEVHEPMR